MSRAANVVNAVATTLMTTTLLRLMPYRLTMG